MTAVPIDRALTDEMSVVIVGAGLAGLRTAEALRRRGFAGRITLLGDEPHPPYERPVLSKKLLTGDDPVLPALSVRPATLMSSIDAGYGHAAVVLDPSRRTVVLGSGQLVEYDRLVIATGAHCRRLPGLPDDLHRLRSFDDALALRWDLARGGAVVIIGGGFIGCEVASSACSLGLSVTVVEAQREILVGVLGDRVAGWLADLHRAHGVSISSGRTVRAVVREHDAWQVELDDGQTIIATVVVEAVGALPTTHWLEGSGIELADGVACDEFGRTNVPGVFAVGDVAAWNDPRTGTRHRHEHWTAAVEQADVVAANLLAVDGELHAYAGDAYVWSDQHGVRVQTVGVLSGSDEVRVLHEGADRLLAAYARAGRVTGIIGVNQARSLTRLRSQVAQGASLVELVAAAEALLVR